MNISEKSKIKSRENFPKILFDEYHMQAWTMRESFGEEINPSFPSDNTMFKAKNSIKKIGLNLTINTSEKFTLEYLRQFDILFLTHSSTDEYENTVKLGSNKLEESEIKAITEFVKNGGSLLLLVEHENKKYDNSREDLLLNFNIKLHNSTISDPSMCYNKVYQWVKPTLESKSNSIFNRVKEIVLYRAGHLEHTRDNFVDILITSENANYKGVSLGVTGEFGKGKIIVLSDSDIFGDDSIDDLDNKVFFENILYFLSPKKQIKIKRKSLELSDNWRNLKEEVRELRDIQSDDGSIVEDKKESTELKKLISSIKSRYLNENLSENMEVEFAKEVVKDIEKWEIGGYKKPDFLDSLLKIDPNLVRVDKKIKKILLPMYTQNGNPRINFELLAIRIVWPEWIDEIEKKYYNNKAFLPIEFIDFTEGYNSHSAVLFPETVPVREVPKFNWGAIFCDREAARFSKILISASEVLNFKIPPELILLGTNEEIAKETYVLWDLVHDRTHSQGELPFDPFMIKQRIPFWMYALEEMRCDLNAYVEMDNEKLSEIPHARIVKYVIILDRVLRFSISGERIKNYDSLVGQIIFGALHKNEALKWIDNTLIIDWDKVDFLINKLANEVNELYSSSIDRSKVGFWLEGYNLVKKYVEPNVSSHWNSKIDFNLSSRELVDKVLPDEFPLNVFFEALKKKLKDQIEDCKGITLEGKDE